jgi:hypothetical protein
MTVGTRVKWRKNEGDAAKTGDLFAEGEVSFKRVAAAHCFRRRWSIGSSRIGRPRQGGPSTDCQTDGRNLQFHHLAAVNFIRELNHRN